MLTSFRFYHQRSLDQKLCTLELWTGPCRPEHTFLFHFWGHLCMSSSTHSDNIPGEGHLFRPVPSGKMFLPVIMGNGVAIIENRVSGTKDLCASSWFADGCSILCWGSFCVQTLVNSGRGSPASCFLHFLSVVLPRCLIPFCHFNPHKISPRSSFSWYPPVCY